MEITVGEAARLLNKTPRAIRYLIEGGQLKARQVGRQFLIRLEELPLTEAQRQEAEKTWGKARDIIDRVLPPVPPPAPSSPPANAARPGLERTYSVRHLRTFTAGGELYPRLVRTMATLRRHGLAEGLEPAAHLLAGLDALSSAFFHFDVRRRRDGYLEARHWIGKALGQVWIVYRWLELAPAGPHAHPATPDEGTAARDGDASLKEALRELQEILTILEGDVMGGLKGLLLKLEGKKQTWQEEPG